MNHPEFDSSENKGLALNRRRFIGYFSAMGLGSTLMPGTLLAQAQEAQEITPDMVKGAARIAGLTFSDEAIKELSKALTGRTASSGILKASAQ